MTPSATAVLQIQEADGAAEARWVIAARTGDADATLRLLTRYRPPLLRLLTGLTGDLATAEDLVQESLLQAFRCLAQLRDPAAFYPWVRRLALRHALRWLRQRREVTVDATIEPDSLADPLRQVETRLAVHAILTLLPLELRVTLVLRELEQLDYQEIAAALRVPVGTVRSRLFTARQRFKFLWEEMEAEE